MSSATYNTITEILLSGVMLAIVAAIVSLFALIVRWKTPWRRGHAVRLLAALLAIPCLIGIQQAILWFVFLPALGREQMATVNAARADRLVETSVVHVGDAVPQFSLATLDGEDCLLPAPGKITVINFFATWCGPCLIELPHIERLWATHKADDHFRLLVIGREEDQNSVREFRDKNGWTFPMAADPDRAVYSLFARESIPRTLVVSPEGTIVYSKAGFSEDDLQELNAVLQQQLASLK